MERVTLPNLPARRAADYLLDGFDPPRYARSIYTPQEAKKDRVTIECQAYEVDANGAFVMAPNGEPSRTSGTVHTISVSGVGDTHTLVPGWVRVVGDYSPTPEGKQSALPDNCVQLTEKPAAPGQEGDLIYIGDTMYRWELGMTENVMQQKALELAQLLSNSAAIASFDL